MCVHRSCALVSFSSATPRWQGVADLLYGPQQRWRGFRTPALVRFISGEGGLVSLTNGGPRVYINIEDLLRYQNNGAVNQDFQAVWAFLRGDACRGRAHWGKTRGPGFAFDGAREFPDTWCDGWLLPARARLARAAGPPRLALSLPVP